MTQARARSSPSRPLRLALGAVGGLTLGIVGIEVALLVDGPASPLWVVLLFPALGGVYVAAGLLAWWRRPSNGIGVLLVGGGAAVLGAGLGNTGVAELIAVGQILATLILAVVVHMLLAFPSGRLPDAASRAIAAAGYVVALVLQAPLYLFAGDPAPYDLLSVADRPDAVEAAEWVQWGAGAAVVAAAATVLTRRLIAASPAQRRVLGPLGLYGILAVLSVPISGQVLRDVAGVDPVTVAALQVAVLAGIPVAFVLGVLRGGFARTGELAELGAWLGAEDGGRARLAGALAQTLGDPTLELAFWLPARGGYVDARGAAAELPRAVSGRAAVEVELSGRRVGAIVYDASLIGDPALVRAAGRVIAIALDRERLTAELLASRTALRDSRARIVEAGDRERRRIAKDLHDGMQARLVLLALAAQGIAADGALPDAARGEAGTIRAGLDDAIAELRRLVHGLMPPLLVERGLSAATEDLVDRVPIPADLRLLPQDEALPDAVESAAYFVVAEGLANVVKHSRARELSVRLDRADGRLTIEVADDGVGGAAANGGAGLRGIADRLDVLGGRLTVDSPPGGGTRLLAEVPCGS
jgi:signal transduction histidine kinase